MNTMEYEVLSREYLPLYTNITVNIGTEKGLFSLPPKTQMAPSANGLPKKEAKTSLLDTEHHLLS